MDFSMLIDEIVLRVTQKLAQVESISQPQSVVFKQIKPKLLVLTDEHGDICHDVLENEKILEHYQTECAKLKNYECDINDYEAVIIFGFDNDALCKLSSGLADTNFTRLAQKAILMGKKIFIVQDTIELYKYSKTAYKPYYEMMLKKLEFLIDCGIEVCEGSSLVNVILHGENKDIMLKKQCDFVDKQNQVVISKRVITEKDIIQSLDKNVCSVKVGKNAILTELAKEYLQAYNVTIIRDK